MQATLFPRLNSLTLCTSYGHSHDVCFGISAGRLSIPTLKDMLEDGKQRVDVLIWAVKWWVHLRPAFLQIKQCLLNSLKATLIALNFVGEERSDKAESYGVIKRGGNTHILAVPSQ